MKIDPHPRSMSSYLIAGILSGLTGLLVFLIIHHFWIRPIWFITPIGMLIAGIGGLSVGWSYYEIHLALPPRPWTSLALAFLIGVMLLPGIIIAQLRGPLVDFSSGAIPPGEGGRVAIHFLLELVLTAALVGAAAGWLLGRSPQALIFTSLAGVVFSLGPGHNIPLLGGTPAAGKGIILLLAIILASAVILVETSAWLSNRL